MLRRGRVFRFRWGAVVQTLLAGLLVIPLVPLPAAAAVTMATGGPFSYTEQDPPLVIGTGTSVSSGFFYDGQYLEFEISGATPDENLALQTVGTPATGNGVVSVVGTAVYVGDGTAAVPIGSIDSVSDGQGGTKLRVNFGSDFRNPGFETGDSGPWTEVEQRVELGVTSIAGFVAADTASYPGNSGGDGDAPVSATYSVSVTSADPPGPTEGTYALGLTSNMTTRFGCDVVHGPAVYSAPFDAAAGQTLTFDWRAFAGSDAYAVFGYLLNTSTGAQTEVLDAYTTNANGTTNWATESVTVPSTGTYRFVFVSGTYDATCGRAAGASLYIDNFQVVSSNLVDDAMVSSVAELLTYEHTGDDPPAARTVTVTAQSITEGSAAGTITVNITPVNDPPIGSPIGASWENTPADDTFADITGTASFTDPDDASLTFGVTGGTSGAFNVGGVDYDYELVGTYGTLYVAEATGDYRIVADDAAIEAVSTPVAETFAITGFDGTDSGTATLTLGILLPPAPRNVVGVPGNAQVTVSWDPPADPTGVTGYIVTGAPGGQTCSTVGVGSTSCVVAGLTNGTPYTFTVVPTTAAGPGTTSLPSDPVIPTGPPGPPLAVAATPGPGRVLVSWDPPANDGGAPITGYTVSASPGGGSCVTAGETSCTVLGLAIGTTYTFTVHAANANGDGPESAPVVVTLKDVTTTALAASPNDVTEGDTVTLTATVTGSSPTGTVEFFDGTTSLGTGSVVGGVATLTTTTLTPGVRNLTAEYSGDSVNYGSTSSSTPVTVKAVASVGLAVSASPALLGAPLVVTASVSGSSPSGTVEFFDGATSLGSVSVAGGVAALTTSSLGLGSHTLSAVYSGDATNTSATSGDVSVSVLAAASVDLAVSASPALLGAPLVVTASVSGSSPSGTVEFFDGATSLGSVSVAGGVAALTTSSLGLGSHTLSAVYSGDATNTSATSGDVSVSVLAAASVDLAVSASPALLGAPLVVTASVSGSSPSGTVEFFDGATSLGSVSVAGGVAALTTDTLGSGEHVITAVYSGDAVNTGATADIAVSVSPPPSVASNTSNPLRGGTVTITGSDFEPNSPVEIWLMGDQPVLLGTATADASGAFSLAVALPAEADGRLDIEVRGTDVTGAPVTRVLALNVSAGLPATGTLRFWAMLVASFLLLIGTLVLLQSRRDWARPDLPAGPLAP